MEPVLKITSLCCGIWPRLVSYYGTYVVVLRFFAMECDSGYSLIMVPMLQCYYSLLLNILLFWYQYYVTILYHWIWPRLFCVSAFRYQYVSACLLRYCILLLHQEKRGALKWHLSAVCTGGLWRWFCRWNCWSKFLEIVGGQSFLFHHVTKLDAACFVFMLWESA